MCIGAPKPPPPIVAPPAPEPVKLKEQQTPERLARKRSDSNVGQEALRRDLLLGPTLSPPGALGGMGRRL